MRAIINDLHRRNGGLMGCIRNYRERCRMEFMHQHFLQLNQHICWATKNVSLRTTTKFRNRIEGLRNSNRDNPPDKLVYNLSSKSLTQAQSALLQRDAGCNLTDAHALDFVAALEPALHRIEKGEDIKDTIRQQVTGLLMNHRCHQVLPQEELRAMAQLKEDDTILVLPADKGRATVVMDRVHYADKALDLLSDTTAYRIVSGDPMVTLKNRVNKVLNALKRDKRIDDHTLMRIRPSDTAMARFYGLPKVHKEGIPLRPIVSFRNTPISGLAKWLSHRISHLVDDSHTTIRSAEDFLDRIRTLRVEDDEVMVSFDVISLFTSIPQDLAVKTVKDLLHRKGLGQHQDSLRPGDLVDLLSLCLKTYFTFQGTVYEQIKGTPMGSPILSVIAEAILQQLEHVAMAQYRPSFWVRYVDDTFVVIKRSQMADFVDILNSVCVDIQFTAEEEHQGKLAFLDVLMHRRPDGTLGTKVYRKPTHTDRILHYHSNHPVAHKVSCIRALFKRVDSHCNTARAKVEEKKYLFHICKLNGYPARFVKRHGALYRPPNIQQMGVLTPQTTRVTLPYVSNVSEATARLLAPHNMSVAHKPVRTLRSYVMRPKDPLPMAEKSGVVYKINCKNCPSNYVGETSKRVKTRVQEHKLAIRRGEQYSQILTHMMSFGHAFDFEDVVVVANDVTKSGRLLKEAWHSQEESINRHIDLRPAHLALRAWEARSHPLRRQQSSTDGFIPLLERTNTNTSRRPDTPWDADMAVRPLRPLRKETPAGPKKLIPDTLAVLPAPSGTLVTTNLNASRLGMHPPPWNERRTRSDGLATPPADVQGDSNCKPSFEGAITRSRKAMQSAGVMDSMATITASTSHSISRPIWGESEKSQFARVYEQPLSSNTGNELTAAQGRGSIVATELNGTEKLGEMTRGRELCSDNTHKTSRVRPRHNKLHSVDGRQRNGGGGEGSELTENPKRGKCFAGGNDASGLSEFVDPSRPRTGRGGESDACLNLDEVCTIQLDESLNHATVTTSAIIGQPGPITRSRSRAQALTYV